MPFGSDQALTGPVQVRTLAECPHGLSAGLDHPGTPGLVLDRGLGFVLQDMEQDLAALQEPLRIMRPCELLEGPACFLVHTMVFHHDIAPGAEVQVPFTI